MEEQKEEPKTLSITDNEDIDEKISKLFSEYIELISTTSTLHPSETKSCSERSNSTKNHCVVNSYHVYCKLCFQHFYSQSVINDINSFFHNHINSSIHILNRKIHPLRADRPMFIWERWLYTGYCSVCDLSGINSCVINSPHDPMKQFYKHTCAYDIKSKKVNEKLIKKFQIVIKFAALSLFHEKFIFNYGNSSICVLCAKKLLKRNEKARYHLISVEHIDKFCCLIHKNLNYTPEDLQNGFNLEEIMRWMLTQYVSVLPETYSEEKELSTTELFLHGNSNETFTPLFIEQLLRMYDSGIVINNACIICNETVQNSDHMISIPHCQRLVNLNDSTSQKLRDENSKFNKYWLRWMLPFKTHIQSYLQFKKNFKNADFEPGEPYKNDIHNLSLTNTKNKFEKNLTSDKHNNLEKHMFNALTAQKPRKFQYVKKKVKIGENDMGKKEFIENNGSFAHCSKTMNKNQMKLDMKKSEKASSSDTLDKLEKIYKINKNAILKNKNIVKDMYVLHKKIEDDTTREMVYNRKSSPFNFGNVRQCVENIVNEFESEITQRATEVVSVLVNDLDTTNESKVTTRHPFKSTVAIGQNVSEAQFPSFINCSDAKSCVENMTMTDDDKSRSVSYANNELSSKENTVCPENQTNFTKEFSVINFSDAKKCVQSIVDSAESATRHVNGLNIFSDSVPGEQTDSVAVNQNSCKRDISKELLVKAGPSLTVNFSEAKKCVEKVENSSEKSSALPVDVGISNDSKSITNKPILTKENTDEKPTIPKRDSSTNDGKAAGKAPEVVEKEMEKQQVTKIKNLKNKGTISDLQEISLPSKKQVECQEVLVVTGLSKRQLGAGVFPSFFKKFGKINYLNFVDQKCVISYKKPSQARNAMQAIEKDGILYRKKKLDVTVEIIKEKSDHRELDDSTIHLLEDPQSLTNFLFHLTEQSNASIESSFKNKQVNLICNTIVTALSQIFSQIQCHPFGSRLANLTMDNSDLDVFVDCGNFYHGNKILEKNHVNMVARALKNSFECEEITFVKNARVPIVSFLHKPTNTYCDISFKNGLGVENTKLLKFMVSLDWRVKPLILFLKYWTKSLLLHGQAGFSSYAISMLVIFYLQQPSVSILPTVELLQKLYKGPRLTIAGWDCSLTTDVSLLPKIENKDPLPKLLLGFFEFYASFNYDKYVISPLTGKPLSRKLFKNPADLPLLYKKQIHNMYCNDVAVEYLVDASACCVMDPFDLSHILTKNLKKSNFYAFVKCSALCAFHLKKGLETASDK